MTIKNCFLSGALLTGILVNVTPLMAAAATFQFDFIGNSGENRGLIGTGRLSFGENSITGMGIEMVTLDELINPEFTFTFNTLYAGVSTEANLEDTVSFSFLNGQLNQLDFDAPVRKNLGEDLLGIGNLQVFEILINDDPNNKYDFVNVNLITLNETPTTSVDVTFGTINITPLPDSQPIPEPMSVFSGLALIALKFRLNRCLPLD